VALAAERYQRFGRSSRVTCAETVQRGWVYMGGQKLQVRVPRIRDQRAKVEVPLQTYRKLQRAASCMDEKCPSAVCWSD